MHLGRLIACWVAAGLIGMPLGASAAPDPQAPDLLDPGPHAHDLLAPDARAHVAQAPASQTEVSPPLRVGRVARLQGTVSFHAAGAPQWLPATLNYPVTSQDGLWTQPSATAEIEVSDSQIDLNAETELDLGTLDSISVAATLAQGELFVDLREIAPGESWTVQTPRGTVLLGGDGRYGIAAGDTEHPTVVTVLAGAATVTVSQTGAGVQAGPGQAVVIEGTDSFTSRVAPAQPDGFLQAEAAASQPKPLPPGISLPPVVARMPGCSQLANYGTWKPAPTYGAVWYPQVARDWVPYRDGHWAYVAPWGWTWVDAAPWGFAPFHYGRWARIDGAWAWVPGEYASGVQQVPQPVYAPALVTFVSPEGGAVGEAASAGFAAGTLVGGAVGWLPLGPREPYYPWFHARPDWVRDVNVGHVANPSMVVNIYNQNHYEAPPGGFANRGAGTLVPSAALVGSRPIAGVGRPLPADALERFQPVMGHEPLRPGPQTAGLTPAVAARLGVAGVPPRLAAPGPALAPANLAPAAVPGVHPGAPTAALPGARPATLPAAVPLHVAGQAPGVTLPAHPGPGVRPAALPAAPPAAVPPAALAPHVAGEAPGGRPMAPTGPGGHPGAATAALPTAPTAPAISGQTPGALPPQRPGPAVSGLTAAPHLPVAPEHAPDRPLMARPTGPTGGEAMSGPARPAPVRPEAPSVRPPETARSAPSGPPPAHPPGSHGPGSSAVPGGPHFALAAPHVAAPRSVPAAPHLAAAVPRAAAPAPRPGPPPGHGGNEHGPHHPG
jgi:hypothetical protein